MVRELELRDGKGDDANVKFEIRSTSPGVSAKFSDDGRELKVKGSVMLLSDLSMMTIQIMLAKFRQINYVFVKNKGERKKA